MSYTAPLSQGWLHPPAEDGAYETVRTEWRAAYASDNWNVGWVMVLCFQGEWVVLPHSKCRSEVPRTLILKQLTPRTSVKTPTCTPNQDRPMRSSPAGAWWKKQPVALLTSTNGLQREAWHLPAHRLSDLVEWRAQRVHSSVSLQRPGNKDHHQISPNCYKNRLWGRQLSILSASFLLLFHYWTSFNRLPKWNATWNCLMPAINNS